MLIDKQRFNYVTHHTIESITQYLKNSLEESGFKVRVLESGSTESFYLYTYYFGQFYKKIRVSNHAATSECDYDVAASFNRPGAINCHQFLIQFLDALHLPYPEQTMNFLYIQDILQKLKSGKLQLKYPENIVVKANPRTSSILM